MADQNSDVIELERLCAFAQSGLEAVQNRRAALKPSLDDLAARRRSLALEAIQGDAAAKAELAGVISALRSGEELGVDLDLAEEQAKRRLADAQRRLIDRRAELDFIAAKDIRSRALHESGRIDEAMGVLADAFKRRSLLIGELHDSGCLSTPLRHRALFRLFELRAPGLRATVDLRSTEKSTSLASHDATLLAIRKPCRDNRQIQEVSRES